MVRCVCNMVDHLGHTTSIYTSWASLDDKRIMVLVCPFITTCYCTSLTNTDATDSGPEPSFDRPAISEVPFRHRRSALEVRSRGLLQRSALTWRDLLGLSLGLRVVDCHYLLLISWRRYTSSCPLSLSFDLVRSFYLVRSFDLPVHASVAQGGFFLFSLKYFPFVIVVDLLYFLLDVVDDALAQGADGLGLMKNEDHQQGAGLDELKHDLSIEEFVAQKCKDAIVENKLEIITLCGANIEPNKSGSEEVADLDLDQLPTLAFVVLVSSIIPISNLSHKTFAHKTGLMTPDLVSPLTYQLLWSSSGNSEPDVSFDMSASPEHLSGSARARLATSTLSGQLRLSHPDCLKETIPYHMHTNTLRAELVYLDLRNYREFYKFSSIPMLGLVLCIAPSEDHHPRWCRTINFISLYEMPLLDAASEDHHP
ncbi:hypothetical protein Tco_0663350 [Tanacetum coccineum]